MKELFRWCVPGPYTADRRSRRSWLATGCRMFISIFLIGAVCGCQSPQNKGKESGDAGTSAVVDPKQEVYESGQPAIGFRDSSTVERDTIVAGSGNKPLVIDKRRFVPDGYGVHEISEEMPEFPGGMAELMRYLKTEVERNYPKDAKKAGVQGRVIVQFVVDEDGSIKKPVVMRSVSPSLDSSAISIVKKMPRWLPGRIDKKPVKVRYTIPVMYRFKEIENKDIIYSTED